MKKKLLPPVLCAVLLLIPAGLGFWYTQPVSISQLAPGLDRDQPAQLHAYTVIWNESQDSTQYFDLTLQDGDPLYEELRAMLDQVQIKRTIMGALMSLVGATARGFLMEDGMVNWVVSLDDSAFQLQYWGGTLLYRTGGGKYADCTVINEEAVLSELTEFFLAHSSPVDNEQ